MRFLSKLIVISIVSSLLAGQCLSFGTGSHFDLTRMVLAEHGFRETPIKIIQVENWLTDYYSSSPTYGDEHRAVLEKLHFDNLFTDEQVKAYWAVLLRNLRSLTEEAASKNDPFSMLVILGMGLHAVQDFYSHSNWAELHPPRTSDEFRAETFFSSVSFKRPRGLHTGKYPDKKKAGWLPVSVPANAPAHGGYHDGLNKDSPLRPRWDEAFVFAYAASYELVKQLETWADRIRPGFSRSVREYVVETTDKKKLDYDILAARNVSMWLEGKGIDGTWKGEASGSSRFFAKFAGNWVTEDSSRFVKAIRNGKIQERLAVDLYKEIGTPELPAIEPFSLERNALIVKVTYVAESKDRSTLRKRLTASLGGSDFYSRIRVGDYEFWGRTLQKSREVDEPWFEIAIVGRNADVVPIVISVWDEDHTDPAKDAHVDLNPEAGLFDLKLVYRTSDGSLSGDIDGIHDSIDKAFSSEGRTPDKPRAVIRGFVSRRSIR